jgi:hypothetical protein
MHYHCLRNFNTNKVHIRMHENEKFTEENYLTNLRRLDKREMSCYLYKKTSGSFPRIVIKSYRLTT